jgi:hypothetical protein
MNHLGMARPTPWAWMLLATCAVTAATLVLFGAVGGLMLLFALNGFSESTGGVIIILYVLAVLAGNFGVSALINWAIARHRYAGTRGTGWAPALIALVVTAITAVIGPPLAILLIDVIFPKR